MLDQNAAIQRAASLRTRTAMPVSQPSIFSGGGMAVPAPYTPPPPPVVAPPPVVKPPVKPVVPAKKPILPVKKPVTPVAKAAAKKVVLPAGINFGALAAQDAKNKALQKAKPGGKMVNGYYLPPGIDFAALARGMKK